MNQTDRYLIVYEYIHNNDSMLFETLELSFIFQLLSSHKYTIILWLI